MTSRLVADAMMMAVDVPMYWARWVSDMSRGHRYLSIAQGLLDASSHWVVPHGWSDWSTEVVWMSLYFSLVVWLSIGLIHVPALFAQQRPQRTMEPPGEPAVSLTMRRRWPRFAHDPSEEHFP